MHQNVYLFRKVAVENVGYVFTHFCGGHKNYLRLRYRSSLNGGPKLKVFL